MVVQLALQKAHLAWVQSFKGALNDAVTITGLNEELNR